MEAALRRELTQCAEQRRHRRRRTSSPVEEDLLRLESRPVEALVGVDVCADGTAVDGDAGKDTARAGVAENLRPQRQDKMLAGLVRSAWKRDLFRLGIEKIG